MTAYEIIKELEGLGYRVQTNVDGTKVKLEFQEDGKEPDPDKVRPLIAELKEKKDRALKILDPRPRLEDDHELWQQLLNETEKVHEKIHWNLHGFRCDGCRLEKIDGRINLKPASDMDQTEYEDLREKYLLPHKDTIKQIFSRVERMN